MHLGCTSYRRKWWKVISVSTESEKVIIKTYRSTVRLYVCIHSWRKCYPPINLHEPEIIWCKTFIKQKFVYRNVVWRGSSANRTENLLHGHLAWTLAEVSVVQYQLIFLQRLSIATCTIAFSISFIICLSLHRNIIYSSMGEQETLMHNVLVSLNRTSLILNITKHKLILHREWKPFPTLGNINVFIYIVSHVNLSKTCFYLY